MLDLPANLENMVPDLDDFYGLHTETAPGKVFISFLLVNNEWSYKAETLLESMFNDCTSDMSGLVTNRNVRHSMTL